MKQIATLGILFFLIADGIEVHAKIQTSALFTDHSVLQHSAPVPVWGTGTPGESVTVSYLDQIQSTQVDGAGKWSVKLSPMKPAQSGDLLIQGKENTIRLSDVVTGDAWLCSGQSNMAWSLASSLNAAEEIAAANYPLIRQFKVPLRISEAGLPANGGEWVPCSPATAGKFTAVGYFFARNLHDAEKIPIGILNCSQGGSPIEAWMSRAALDGNPQFSIVRERWDKIIAAYPQKLAAWQKESAAPTAPDNPGDAAAESPTAKRAPADPAKDFHAPSALYSGMLQGLAPYAIRGAIWYQGESNVQHGEEYGALLKALISDWRRQWGQGDFPFYFVQLPKFGVAENSNYPGWILVREGQRQALTLPNTGMAVTIDLGDGRIHPTDKRDVGKRLALIAQAKLYGSAETYSGPLFQSAIRKENTLELSFSHSEGGLFARKPETLSGFEIAGVDGTFHPATALIQGEKVFVSATNIPRPKFVRYAWKSNPASANLTDASGLPASPFRAEIEAP